MGSCCFQEQSDHKRRRQEDFSSRDRSGRDTYSGAEYEMILAYLAGQKAYSMFGGKVLLKKIIIPRREYPETCSPTLNEFACGRYG